MYSNKHCKTSLSYRGYHVYDNKYAIVCIHMHVHESAIYHGRVWPSTSNELIYYIGDHDVTLDIQQHNQLLCNL